MNLIKIKEEHYNAPLSWIYNCDIETFFEIARKYGYEGTERKESKGIFWADGGICLIWVDHNLPPDEFLRHLNHELLHYCLYVLDNRGVPVRYENEECIAYFQEKMLKKCMKVNLKKYKKS